MNPAHAVESKSEKSAEPKYAPQTKLSVVYFNESVSFGGVEMNSASVGLTSASNSVDSIVPGWLAGDGSILVGHEGDAEGARGMVLRKKRHNLHTGKRTLDQTLVPWSNIKNVGFGE